MSVETAVKERPLIVQASGVRAILAGRKTQDRRVVFRDGQPEHHMPWRVAGTRWQDGDDPLRCWFGEPRDRLWVREAWCVIDEHETELCVGYPARGTKDWDRVWIGTSKVEREPYVGPRFDSKLRSPVYMPRWASRLTLEITGVRVERLQDISHEDALAEGCAGTNWVARSPYIIGPHTDDGELPQEEFARIWHEINGKRHPWTSNPWVWVLEFRRV